MRAVNRTGRFDYFLGGEKQPLTETFEIDGSLVTSRRQAPDFGVDLTVRAVYLNDGAIDGGAALGASPAGVSIGLTMPNVTVTAEYRRTDDRMRVLRTVDGHAFEDEVSGPALLLPLLRIYAGPVVRALGVVGTDGAPVCVPDIRPGTAPTDLLAPVVDARTAELVEAGHGATTYRVVGGSYESGAEFTLDAAGLLTQYRWDQEGVGAWLVRRVDDHSAPDQI
jgi:hypothetical protein